MTCKHLEERFAYEERYDRHTVEECRRIEDLFLSSEIQGKRFSDGSGFPDRIIPLQLFSLTSDRYLQREKAINERIERDRQRDAMVEQTRPPLIRCPSCQQVMECIHASLHFGFADNEPDKMEFFLACKPCQQSRHVYENGREVIREPILCEKCNREVESSREERDGKRYYIRTCKHCGHVEETLSVLDEEEKEPTQKEIERFNRDKQRFCISDEQGKRYVEWTKRMKELEKQKEEHLLNMDLYDKLKEIKKFTIAGLEERLKAAIKKAGYDDLHISMPASEREIMLHFSVRDLRVDREEFESRKALEKLIEGVVDETNWALSDGVSYRLGLLSGRIRGYESQEDLQTLTRSRMKKKPMKKKTEEVPIEF